MKNIIAGFVVILTFLALVWGCKKDDTIPNVPDDGSIATIEGTWKVLSYDDLTNNTQIFKNTGNTWTDYNNGDVIVTFTDTIPECQMHGITVTNEVFGTYTLSAPRKIQVENFLGTLINQPDWADLFWEGITKAEEFSVNSNELRIYYNSGKNSITFEKLNPSI